jgi:membrane protease YdiL (CAAX protease family)
MTGGRAVPLVALVGAILAGCAVWIVAFAWRPANFWLLMSAGVGALGALAFRIRAFSRTEGLRAGDAAVGVASAAVLYAIFVLGRDVVLRLVPGAPAQIDALYALRSQAPSWVIVLSLVCVIAPGEEFFWRGLVPWGLVGWLGPRLGWAAATAIYAGVHLSANPMLAVAAAVAGGFWGVLYLRAGRIAPLVISHIAWDLAVFFIVPFR